ncbi:MULTISPECIES: hypothetical protein [unclassified Lysobacter]|uniref:hypothetical protein n=1 Tax=unclassified Lysobacter TaxID=2635362 RepID=UPI0012F97E5A|nr:MULTISPECIES: hypothetical protein [unclassified Lysobacter]
MNPMLPTDEETNRFFDEVVSDLHASFGYSVADASTLAREYYSRFRSAQHCGAIGIPVQDDDFFFHEGVTGMALRSHYHVGLGKDPYPHAFIEWRSSFCKPN